MPQPSLEEFAFRRAAARAIAAPSLSTPLRSQSQSIRSYSLATSRCKQIPSTLSSSISFQRRWASDQSTAETREEPAADDNIEHSKSAIPEKSESENDVKITEEAQSSGSSMAEAVANAADSTQGAIDRSSAPQGIKDALSSATGAVANAAAPEDYPTVFVGNLFFHIDEAKLGEEFAKFGKVVGARIARDPRGMSKGFGFVEFETNEEQQAAIDQGHNQLFDGRIMSVQPRTGSGPKRRSPVANDLRNKGPGNPPSRTLFVGNMSYDMSDTDLNNLFRPLKNVLDVRVAIDRRTGQARGFAHADFTDIASAKEGFEHLEKQIVYGRKLRIDYGVSHALAEKPAEPAE